jgi:hypothetical protein
VAYLILNKNEEAFNRQFKETEQDKQLMSHLIEELPGILNWAIQGCLNWQANGLVAPFVVKIVCKNIALRWILSLVSLKKNVLLSHPLMLV